MEPLPFTDSGINYESNLQVTEVTEEHKCFERTISPKRKWLLAHGPQAPGPVG